MVLKFGDHLINTAFLSAVLNSDSIDDNMQVKITDNALSRDLFPMDYHCLGDNENRPVRWMALESLLNNDFSSASDVVRIAKVAKITFPFSQDDKFQDCPGNGTNCI